MNNSVSELIEFLDNSPSAYHAAYNLVKMLWAHGYEMLPEHEDWTLLKGGKYFMIRGGTTLVAFISQITAVSATAIAAYRGMRISSSSRRGVP